jgi:HAD superfamily phosphoserine phosphatase-like hydrolase
VQQERDRAEHSALGENEVTGGTAFCFDLDGTVTTAEVLPIIASEVGLTEEIKFLTDMTIKGQIPFEMSFRLRCALLSRIDVATVAEIVATVPVAHELSRFLEKNSERCFIITGNLDVWVCRLIEQIGCQFHSSKAEVLANGQLGRVTKILRKSDAIRHVRSRFERIVCIGEGYNDLPMFEEADIGVAYAGVHHPARELIDISDYVAGNAEALCRLLRTL